MVQLMPLPPIINCFIKIHDGVTFLEPAYPGYPGKNAVKWVSVFFLKATSFSHFHKREANYCFFFISSFNM